MTQTNAPVELMICVKCRRGEDVPEDGTRPGQRLFDAVAERGMPEGVTLTPVECLQNCDSGCSAAMGHTVGPMCTETCLRRRIPTF
jgi:predicted metal-binding protein